MRIEKWNGVYSMGRLICIRSDIFWEIDHLIWGGNIRTGARLAEAIAAAKTAEGVTLDSVPSLLISSQSVSNPHMREKR